MTLFNTRIFETIASHRNHDISLALYGTDDTVYNVAIECQDCHEILFDIEPEESLS